MVLKDGAGLTPVEKTFLDRTMKNTRNEIIADKKIATLVRSVQIASLPWPTAPTSPAFSKAPTNRSRKGGRNKTRIRKRKQTRKHTRKQTRKHTRKQIKSGP